MVDTTRLKRKLKAVQRRVENAVRAEMAKYADQIVAQMRMLVGVEEGTLRDSIDWTWGAAPSGTMSIVSVKGKSVTGIFLTIHAGNASTIVTNSRGVEFQNALIQEFGTKDRAANPFFYPVWRANRRRVRSGINRAIKKVAKATN